MDVATKSVKHSAPGPYLGFALQPLRLCYHLLNCQSGAKVSLEFLDDIAVHNADDTLLVEQDKSATRTNPVADWSPDLWKTFANWLDAVASGKINAEKTIFQLYITPERTGKICRCLSDAKTPEQVKQITDSIKEMFGKSKKKKECEAFLKRFLEAPEDERFYVVSNFRLLSQNGHPLDVLRGLVKTTVDPRLVDTLCSSAIGMAKEQADDLLRQGKIALIDADAFKARFREFVRTVYLPNWLAPLTPNPPQHEVSALFSARPTFIRQLEIIEISDAERLRAVGDFLRTSAEKSALAEAGIIYQGNFAEWDDNLLRNYDLISGEISDLHADKETALRGRMVYRRCSALQTPLDGRVVPEFFVSGCFNALSDDLRLGWHPDYKSILSKDAQ